MKGLKKEIILLIFINFIFVISAGKLWGKNPDLDYEKTIAYQKKCEEVKKYGVKGRYQVHCGLLYHHFNSNSPKKYFKKFYIPNEVRVGTFNVLHPGQRKTLYKDYGFMAQIINQWDILAAVELLPVLGPDLKENKKVFKFIQDRNEDLDRMNIDLKLYARGKEKNASKARKVIEAIKLVRKEMSIAKTIYRVPGYLKLLDELRKIDRSWALILSPRGEAARETNVQELVGFFYRGKRVSPVVNEYCKEIFSDWGEEKAYGCIPNFYGELLDRELANVFSRRPFIASFKSGLYDFTLVASHVVFNSPREEDKMKNLLELGFGVSNLKDLGRGANKQNYARFAEVRATLEFMEALRYYYWEQDILFLGDFNLEKKNPYWDKVLPFFDGANVLIEEKTSLRPGRFESNGRLSSGYSSNYDHIVLDPYFTDECTNEKGEFEAYRYDFYKGPIAKKFRAKYEVRKAKKKGPYSMDRKGKAKMSRRIRELKALLNGEKEIKRGKILTDSSKHDKIIRNYERRVFESQLSDRTYNNYVKETLSDHAPVGLNCSYLGRDDD